MPAQTVATPEALADLDTQLMLRVREGDSAAAAALVRRNFARVARYVGRVVRDRRTVEDLVHDVFLQVFKSAQRYEPTAKFSTWLYCVATNIALNYLHQARMRKECKPDPERTPPDVADRSGAAPDHELSLDEMRAQVSAAISHLPINQRIALVLFENEGLSYEQIAAALNTTVEAVRNLLKRARQTLRAELRELL